MSDFTDSLVAMKDATEELVQAKEVFESIYEGYQGALDESIQTLRNLERYAQAVGKNTLSVTAEAIVSDLAVGDEISLIISNTNDEALVSLDVNAQGAKSIVNVTAANQLFAGALVKVRYDGTAFYVIEQINPKTGNAVADIGKLVTDTTDLLSIGEVALNGAELNRTEFAIAWAKIKNTSNLIDQATKDADPITYGGYWGEGNGVTTFTLPIVGGEFIRMFDDGRGVDAGRGFADYQSDLTKIPNGVILRVSNFGNGDGSYDLSGTSTSANGNDLHTAPRGNSSEVYYETRPRNIAYYGKTRL
ncbi:hypothetical protein MED121_07225 [Marinomonas sp. MED121]|uniref:hypothetical protein n=1 Tax=Marinomonas sp. MED121 TaxID=314277 RepID=UPI00006902FA|nr:hypothetical protein [Marinomonas sp. MED121]EAQ66456.1 hypothetical protein MED121_07225 [Marinomonas sp. MED121]